MDALKEEIQLMDNDELLHLLEIAYYVRKQFHSKLGRFYNDVHEECVNRRTTMSFEFMESIRNMITAHGVVTSSIFFPFGGSDR